jgi:Asp-tRNA(Asn)/Glu-tRNA(Gln) amidotransferase A subunit family amidase
MPVEPLTITAAAPLIRSGELTPSELLEQCLRRIDVYESHVKAWVYLDRERARRDAAKLTDEVKSCYRGPLHGIPIGVKDIIDVFDMPTGCGSKLWANSYARQDATVVDRLRHAGAIILGKTVTTPYAYTDPPVTRNPWNLERTPGGSSSGSAAAVACGMSLGALGTQTGGSLIRPASYCGVFCIKPTWGRVSVDGVLPLAPSLDHVGVMANCVRDLSLLLQPMAKTDEDNYPYPYHYNHEIELERDYDPKQLSTFPDYMPDRFGPEMKASFTRFRATTHAKDWRWQEVPLHPLFHDVIQHHKTIMSVEASTYHRDRLSRYPDEYGPKMRALIEDGLRVSAVDFSQALQHQRLIREESRAMFLDGWDIAVLPATGGPAPDTSTTGDPTHQAPWSYLGLPVVSLPFAGCEDGMPLAVQLIASEWFEDDILRAAAKLEADLELSHRLPPVPA